jgi:hypothetical protein
MDLNSEKPPKYNQINEASAQSQIVTSCKLEFFCLPICIFMIHYVFSYIYTKQLYWRNLRIFKITTDINNCCADLELILQVNRLK